MAFLIYQLLAESAKKNPDGVAVDGGESTLTYAQLDALSNQIAHQLRADGVCNGDRVGVFLPKSAQTVAALLGILKAGSGLCAGRLHSPTTRAAYVLGNCSVRALITSSSIVRKLDTRIYFCDGNSERHPHGRTQGSAGHILPGESGPVSFAQVTATRPSTDPKIALTENDLAYIFYTSGSTGQPKGVMISHLNSFTFVNWCFDEYQVSSNDRGSSHAPFHFDLSIFDFFRT